MNEKGDQEAILCKSCGKPLTAARAGAISSYLLKDLRCNCGSSNNSALAATSEKQLCRRCGKPVAERLRGGSLTQFIFAAGRCQCQTPLLRKPIKLDERKLATLTKRWTRDDQAARREKSTTFTSGSLIGSTYIVDSVLGRGGMGTVYKARHVSLGRACAVKVLDLNLVDEENWKRFQIEARAISNLNHPCFVQVYDLALHDNKQPYYVMDCLEGETLEEILDQKGALTTERALPIFLEVAEGLAFAHNNGVVHRDLKPANIFIETLDKGQKRVKILDFGIAKLLGADREQQSLTGLGDIFGTPYYMSPEQCLGEQVDTRSDIYSLGCTMFEALSERPPFDDEQSVAVVEAHTSTDAPMLSEVAGAELPPGLEAVIAKCLEKNPEDRYQNMQQFIAHLRLIARGQGNTIAESNSLGYRNESKLVGRGPDLTTLLIVSLAIFASAGLIVLLLGITVAVGGRGNPNEKAFHVNKNTDLASITPFDTLAPTKPGSNNQIKDESAIEAITGTPDDSDPPQPPTTLSVNGQVKYYNLYFGSGNHGNIKIIERSGPVKVFPATGKIVLPNDQRLFISFEPRLGNDIEAFKAFPDDLLNELNISVKLADNALRCCGRQRKIQSIRLNTTYASDVALKSLADFPKLKSLVITDMADLSEDELAPAIAKLTNLKVFKCDLMFSPTSSELIKALTKLPNLKELKLTVSRLGSDDLADITSLKNLRILDLTSTSDYIKDSDMESISALKQLTHLTLNHQMLTPRSIGALSSLKNLHYLRLVALSPAWSAQDRQKLTRALPHTALHTEPEPNSARATNYKQ